MMRPSILRKGLPRVSQIVMSNIVRGSTAYLRQPMIHMSHSLKYTSCRSYSISTEGEILDGKIDNISLNEYNKIANEYLESIADSLEFLSEDHPEIDCELSQGVMTLTVPQNGTYVINKQPPNKQIWLSSPISGPKRYDLIGGRWITLRDDSSLTELLEQEISDGLGIEFNFEEIEA